MASTSSQTPSSSTAFSTPTSWDVFLSFRGLDTRYSFTSHLYSALDRYNIRTFMDDPELQCGEVMSAALPKAIQESKTYILVISENYASSSWCLDELVEILSCSNTMQRLVIPVFYNIDPSVVRHQTKSFEKHFERHEDRLAGEMERVDNWRLALKQVADKSGHHIDGNKYEADIVNEIVDQILPQINPTALDVARFPVGLTSRVQDIRALLSSGTKDVIKFGIYGMGGVGKTTLAKAVFNDQLSLGSFKGSCFLENVREISGSLKGLESLQQQLINDVLKSKNKVEVSSVSNGTMLIQTRICSKTILVVVDDLDDHEKFESLVGPFASGSVVIITTRNEETLNSIEVETQCRYKVKELGDAESETLFFRHAFRDTEPKNTLMVLSKDILRLAGGLPLALKVFGSHLYNKSDVGWKSYIETLQRNPNSTIQQRLMISLDALESDDPLLKKMFLDIACLFIGMEKEEVVKILDTYYSFSDVKIDTLKKRCLLTINERDQLRMHDLLQDVGKEMARNNSPDEPGKHSRLWVREEICDVLHEDKGTEAIEGIMLSYFKSEDPSEEQELSFAMETLRRMNKLRFLFLEGINLTGKFERTLEDLRWFRWSWCPLKCLPFDFCPKKLVILELPDSEMTTMWKVNMVSNVFEQLKTLNMSFSIYLTNTSDFSRLPCLQNLDLEGCRSLKKVHISIGSLVSLVSLNLTSCVSLRSLPDTICNLRALEVLCIEDCTGLEALPIQLGNIESLTELNACGLTVQKLPDSIGNLIKLVKLKLDYNKKLEYLPSTIGNLRALEVLSISHCTNLEALPDELGNMKSLRELSATFLAVSRLPDSIGYLSKLVKLDLDSNQKLKTLPNTICNMRSLEELYIMDYLDLTACHHLLSIAELPPSLISICASECTALETLNLSNLKHLEAFSVENCSALTDISGLAELTSLREMNLRGCHSSLLARTLTKSLFQIYSKQQVRIWLEPEKFPDWMIQSSVRGSREPGAADDSDDWSSESGAANISSYVNLQPNLSHNYLGMILCFKMSGKYQPNYSVLTSASNILLIGSFRTEPPDASRIDIVPRSMFKVTDADHSITFTSNALSHWIHILYKNEDDSTTVIVEDERNTPSDSELEVGGYPSKRSKLLECVMNQAKSKEVITYSRKKRKGKAVISEQQVNKQCQGVKEG